MGNSLCSQKHPKLWLTVIVAGLFSLLTSQLYPAATQEKKSEEARKALELQVAVVLAKAGPTLAFTALNKSEQDLSIEKAGISGSPIKIVKPDGETATLSGNVLRSKPLPPLKAGQILAETYNIKDTSDLLRLNDPGVYRLYWETRPQGSNVTYKSNQILILRDKDTPVFDPTTGLPIVQPK